MANIIFIHRGYADYFYYVLRQARIANHDASIHLIGDASNKVLKRLVNHHDYSDYFTGAAEFEKYYRHYSTNPYNFELFAIQRFFIMREFLTAHGIDSWFYADSDVMIFCDIVVEARKFRDFDMTLSLVPEECVASIQCSFWNNRKSLDKFCQFVMDMYLGKDIENYKAMINHYENLQSKGAPGGICDMTIGHVFVSNHYARVGDTQDVIDGSTFDHNISVSLNGGTAFEMQDGIKRIDWIDGIPYGTILGTGEKIRFNTLHLQGSAKKYAQLFYKKSNRRWRWR